MNVLRLTHLITVLERVERERLGFNMEKWYADRVPCGTVCCAGGWAALDPVFNAEGLRTHHFISTPNFDDHAGYEALGMFFGLNRGCCRSLFDPHAYNLHSCDIRPHHVIANIREMLAEHTATKSKES